MQSVRLTLYLLWVVAALVIGSVVYLSALERVRDFAVYKATGWTTRDLATGLPEQARNRVWNLAVADDESMFAGQTEE